MNKTNELFPKIEIKTLERVIPDAKAEEVTQLFYDAVKKYDPFQWTQNYSFDGIEKTFVHTIWKIEILVNNRLKVHDVIYADPIYEPGDPPRTPMHILDLNFQAWQIQFNRVLVKIDYSPFLADTVINLLSCFKLEPPPESFSKPPHFEVRQQKGRGKLGKDEIQRRKKIVREAEKIKKENPDFLWEKIADDLGIPERTLRDWRHNPTYK
jgi:hypothetical protein